MYEKDKARYAQEMKDFESKSSVPETLDEAPAINTAVQLRGNDLGDVSGGLG